MQVSPGVAPCNTRVQELPACWGAANAAVARRATEAIIFEKYILDGAVEFLNEERQCGRLLRRCCAIVQWCDGFDMTVRERGFISPFPQYYAESFAFSAEKASHLWIRRRNSADLS